jgi:hypothetical protein
MPARYVLGIVVATLAGLSSTVLSQPRGPDVPYPYQLGVYFRCPLGIQATSPELGMRIQCHAAEHVRYRGESVTLLDVGYSPVSSGDSCCTYSKGAYFIAYPDGRFERMEDSVGLTQGRYNVFFRTVGLGLFWRNNLNQERVFESELSVENGKPCIVSRLQFPHSGTISQCAGEMPVANISESPGAISLAEAIDIARQALEKQLPPRTLETRPFPSVFSQREPIGEVGNWVTFQTSDVGQPYWAMTYGCGFQGPHYLIRVFFDRRVELEPATRADVQKWNSNAAIVR